MGKNHKVRFEPVGVEIDVDEDETVLNAAFRQGVMLMHGCKEGQCSACKSFLLDGDLQMERYSTFALADYESEEGYVLLCRARAYSDLEVELLNYDEDMIRSGLPLVTFETTVEALDDVSPDITRLRLKLGESSTFRFHPGQYVDLRIPGSEDHRSFSMANTSAADGYLEFLIKRYPGGRFSGLLENEISEGDPLTATGPYGTFTLRVSSDRRLVFVGGGAGMAPILALLRQMVESRTEREAVFYYGARTAADLICASELAEIGEKLPGFRFVPCLSDSWPDGWDGETGLVTAVLDQREPDLDDSDVYLCGPPPMIDAGLALLESRSVPAEQVFYDKFTLTAASE
ncbi:FAD-binding oxidoreductase [Cryptosporangium phraense]|uniref:2Fe-2S iron-sulfur cluster binding domain-containing protein n=1 Tax=Cryptosporangium phraense TaxID=2593070 RepID=A0A545B051_9ACTN|nr:FAD-binding oxidoreductase [Cryptosporangium phraense]TQS46952.1 2Fe-2S iron-sulfur cluster binding domain-containing protein [Cryptosporangium phraense]